MRKVLLSTILWFICVAVFAQTEPAKYLIKYLDINTAQSDYSVTFLSDNEFIYKSPNTEKIYTDSRKLSESNLFIATTDDIGDITEKKEIQSRPTKKSTNTGAAFSADGKTVYFSAKRYSKRPRKNDKEQLFIADVDVNGKWMNIKSLPFSDNSYSFGEPSLSASGEELYFTSDKPGGMGGTDIYMISINSDGSFGEPVNLGNIVNTSGNEVTPYITKGNKLYFSSNKHADGFGNLDVYSLDFNNPTAKPVHLDAPVNGPNDDWAFIINNDDTRGYFSSNRLQGQNNHDIYSFLVEKVKEDGPCEQAITGIVKDNDTKEILKNATITLYDDDHNELEQVTTDDQGKYKLTLDCNKTYTLKATAQNYNTEDHIVNTANYLDAPTLEANKFLIKKTADEIESDRLIAEYQDPNDNKEVKEKVKKVENSNKNNAIDDDEDEISPIYFGFDKEMITTKAARELDKLVDILKNNKTIHVELSSYTDSRGSNEYNLKLSERRAQASEDYLVAKGISRSRITAKGFGESKMVNKCIDGIDCSEAAHEKNRRTEFAFINAQAYNKNFDNKPSKEITRLEEIEAAEEIVAEKLAEKSKQENELIQSKIAAAKVEKEKLENLAKNTANDVPVITEKTKEPNSSNNKEEIVVNENLKNVADTSNEKVVQSLADSNNPTKEEETLSEEAKWLNDEIEKQFGKNTNGNSTPNNSQQLQNKNTASSLNKPIEEEALSDEAKWLNDEIEKQFGKNTNGNSTPNNSQQLQSKNTPTSLNKSNEEETLSDEGKRLNSEIEKQFGKNSSENLNSTENNNNDTSKIEKSIEEAKKKERETNYQLTNKPIETNQNGDKEALANNGDKFNFEKDAEKPKAAATNVDPNQMLADIKAKGATETPTSINEVKTDEKKPIVKKESTIVASQVSISGMQSKKGKYSETDNSKRIQALRVTFRIQSNGNNTAKGYKEAYIVIKSPTGKVISEKGAFKLADGNELGYTDQTTLYYDNASIKAVMFIDKIAHNFTKGVYTVNIYIDGFDVGENILTLS